MKKKKIVEKGEDREEENFVDVVRD